MLGVTSSPLSLDKITTALRLAGVKQAGQPLKIRLFKRLNSTNTWLKNHGDCGVVCLAEQQTQGRGRRGKHWLSPDAENIYLSFQACFEIPPPHFSLLSLVVGLSIVETLDKIGLSEHGVKWPNDIYWRGKKMGGILIESIAPPRQRATVAYNAVIGIGLNINMPESMGNAIDQPWVSLSKAMGQPIDRSMLLALLLEKLSHDLNQLHRLDLAEFQHRWQRWDILNNRRVDILLDQQILTGVVKGIDAQGCLGVQLQSGELQYYASADIHLKK
ncbi:MAG: biotin--[acetyl-CoA-carboxylase] ligase [Cocleimonas sp.]|nr:biotin--[acetyl-CoA-carboxylase] ligase [Cocleimonas sp.]